VTSGKFGDPFVEGLQGSNKRSAPRQRVSTGWEAAGSPAPHVKHCWFVSLKPPLREQGKVSGHPHAPQGRVWGERGEPDTSRLSFWLWGRQDHIVSL